MYLKHNIERRQFVAVGFLPWFNFGGVITVAPEELHMCR